MKVKRSVKSFSTGRGSGPSSMAKGELVPDNHPLVKKFPGFFEDVEDFVARNHPGLCQPEEKQERKRPGRPKPTRDVRDTKDEANHGSE